MRERERERILFRKNDKQWVDNGSISAATIR